MQSVLYDGSFDGWLCAVFDVYEYRYAEVQVFTPDRFKGDLFGAPHDVRMNRHHAERVWKGLERKLSAEALMQIRRAFLSEAEGIETVLLDYARYAFSSTQSVENDFSNPAVLTVTQTARKVWREQHRMEAFVRFQKTVDGLFFALVEPDHDVLPLIAPHFGRRYADQHWLIYDGRRRYGIHYDGTQVLPVELELSEFVQGAGDIKAVYDPQEAIFQRLWQQYFQSVNIAARKNTKLHVQHMPRRYWRYLVEKQPGVQKS